MKESKDFSPSQPSKLRLQCSMPVIALLLATINTPTLVNSAPMTAPLPALQNTKQYMTPVLPRPSDLQQKPLKQYIKQWIIVPDWLAGTWKTGEQTIIASFDYKTGNNMMGLPQKIPVKRISKVGEQLDKNGRIWHAGAPYTKILDAGTFNEVHEIQKIAVLSNSPTLFEIWSSAKVTRVNKADNRVLSQFLEEANTEYTPLSDGRLLVDFQIQDRSTAGEPLFSSRAMCTQTKLSSFEIVNEDERGPLRLMFQNFLKESGREHLLP